MTELTSKWSRPTGGRKAQSVYFQTFGIPEGQVIYAEAAGDGTLDTDVVLDAGSGNTAKGHVVLDLEANTGTATFSGGTGKFVGFEARADVTADSDGLWHWDGTYSFS